MNHPTARGGSHWTPPGALTLLLALSCGGGSSPTAPRMPAAVPTTTATPTSSSLLGGYGTQPCCCGFWTYTLTRGGETSSWSCWGWIEFTTQEGSEIVGYTNMEKNATDCPDNGRCTYHAQPSSGVLDGAGNVIWTHGAGDAYSREIAERSGCSLVSDGGILRGVLNEGTLTLSSDAVLRCDGATAQLTLSARGVKVY